jgi:hypothetical protein
MLQANGCQLKMSMMSETGVVLEIDHPHLVIRLSEDLLRIDVKGSFKDKVEEALGNTPILKDVFALFVPLHVRLCDMDSARIEETGKVKIVLRHRRDMTLPVGVDEAKTLVDKLNELIPAAKARELELVTREHKFAKEEIESARTMAMNTRNPGLMGEEQESEKEIEKKNEEDRD